MPLNLDNRIKTSTDRATPPDNDMKLGKWETEGEKPHNFQPEQEEKFQKLQAEIKEAEELRKAEENKE